MRPVLVGEANPWGSDPFYALYPYPERYAGWRLCHLILGLYRRTYLGYFDRVNLCAVLPPLRRLRTGCADAAAHPGLPTAAEVLTPEELAGWPGNLDPKKIVLLSSRVAPPSSNGASCPPRY